MTKIFLVSAAILSSNNNPGFPENPFINYNTTSIEHFKKFRKRIYFKAFNNIMRLKDLDSEQAEIRSQNLGNLVDAAILHRYNEIMTPESDIHLDPNHIIEFGDLGTYRCLYLSRVPLNGIPAYLFRFFRPFVLHIENSGISSIETLYSIKGIAALSLDNNNISELPKFESLKELKVISLFGNKIKTPLEGTVSKNDGVEAIGVDGELEEYLETLKEISNNATIIFNRQNMKKTYFKKYIQGGSIDVGTGQS